MEIMDLWRRKRKKQLCEIDCIASFLKIIIIIIIIIIISIIDLSKKKKSIIYQIFIPY